MVRLNGFIAPCIPTRAAKPPSGPDWIHEIKHDGYRLIVRRDGDTVRLFTRRGYDWSDRYPAISRAAAKLHARSFTIDGEAAVCGPDGIAIFDVLHRRGTVTEPMLFAFDLLELDGVDYRPLPLRQRKERLSRLVDRRFVGIAMVDHTDARGQLVFEQACPHGPGGHRVEAAVEALSVRAIAALAQGQEPGKPGDDTGAGLLRRIGGNDRSTMSSEPRL
jgi:ATP-dependent DNA ligase